MNRPHTRFKSHGAHALLKIAHTDHVMCLLFKCAHMQLSFSGIR